MASVTFDHVTKVYPNRGGEVTALQKFTIEVNDGELTVLLGPSGCGKTTALRLVAGLEQPTGGVLRIAGASVAGVPPRHRNVAWVGQQQSLYPHMDVYNNLAFGLRMTGVPKADTRSRIAEAAAMLRLEPLLHRRPDELSGGECQRVALGRALVRRPAVFLLDEPMSSLDAALRRTIRGEIRQLQTATRSTVIHVTHDQEEALALADRIAVIDRGMLQQVAPPSELYERPANRFVAGFVGSPPMNFAPATWTREGHRHSFECLGASFEVSEPACFWPARDGPDVDQSAIRRLVTLGVRPEHCSVVSDRDESRVAHASLEGASREPWPSFGGFRVAFVEVCGHEAHVNLKSMLDEPWIVRIAPDVTMNPGSAVRVRIDPSRMHLFSTDASGTRLN